MDDPLAELEAWWSGKDDDDYHADTILLAYAEKDEVCRIQFATDYQEEPRAEWRLEIQGCEESLWRGEYGSPRWSSDHVLLAPYQDRGSWISFSKPLPDPLRAGGALAQAHRTLAETWVPLDRYLRPRMLEASFGILAQGPERFMAAYEIALKTIGADTAMASPSHVSVRHEETAPSVLTWGESYFVARSFQLERTA